MALLGTYIDKTAGVSYVGPTTTTVQHSLGQTPDEVRFAMRSIANATVPAVAVGLGGNASLSTVFAPSVISAGTVFGDIFAIYYHSIVR